MTVSSIDAPEDSIRRRQAIDAWTTQTNATDDIRAEAKEFLRILEQRVSLLAESSEHLTKQLDHVQLDDYLAFRDVMSQCWTFSILIENRIARLESETVSELLEQFDELTVAIWSVLLGGALVFFKALADETYLPLGSREIFMGELKTLYDADHLLRQERYFSRVNKETLHCLDKSQKILLEIIERAPKLLKIWR